MPERSDIYVDADACPVKEEVYRVAERLGCKVFLVSNHGMWIPRGDWVELVLAARGREFTEESIGDAMATRELMSQLREMGEVGGGPPPFDKRDRSRFLQKLGTAIQTIRRRR